MNRDKKIFKAHGSVMNILGNLVRGKRDLHGSRHRRSQMKLFSRPKRKQTPDF